MKFLRAIFRIFRFIGRVEDEKEKYAKLGYFGKIFFTLLEVGISALSLAGLHYSFLILNDAPGSGIERVLAWFGGILLAIIAVYALVYCFSGFIINAIVCFSYARNPECLSVEITTKTAEAIAKKIEEKVDPESEQNEEQTEDQVKETVEENKDKHAYKRNTHKTFDIVLGFMHIVFAIGIIVSAVLMFTVF